MRVLSSGGEQADQFVDRDSSTGLARLFHSARRFTDGGEEASPLVGKLLAELENPVLA
jgi:hypothetical protein